jgi:hypothetical protein
MVTITNQFKQARAWEHYVTFEQLAQHLGVPYLTRCVLAIASKEEVITALQTDEHLNNTPLRKWDGCRFLVKQCMRGKYKFFSDSISVCVLKHIARYYVAEQTPPPEITDELTLDNLAKIEAEFKRYSVK